jgi:hypothetical protein
VIPIAWRAFNCPPTPASDPAIDDPSKSELSEGKGKAPD